MVKCENCGVVEELTTPDSVMREELEKYFGTGWEDRELAIVCDKCWQMMHPAKHPDLVNQAKKDSRP